MYVHTHTHTQTHTDIYMVSLITVAPIEYSINICQMGHLQLPDTH